jgi:AIPR protein
MATHIRPLEIEVLCTRLQADFGALIAGQGNNNVERERNFYTRALPAFLLVQRAGATVEQAVSAIVDGGGDHGIDAAYVSADNTIWLLQSKYIDAGLGEPDLGDVHKFCTGARDLLGQQWARFNAALNAKTAELTRALKDETCRVQVMLVHTGGAVSDDRRTLFAELERDFNAANSDFLRTQSYGLASLHDLHLESNAAQAIDAQIALRDYGLVETPYRALYGRLPTWRLAELSLQYGDALVERNIRRFKGSTSVNDDMTATLRQHADQFFYFNNGITFLCESFNEVGARDPRRAQGNFNVRGLSVINGAQTLGAIAREPAAHYDAHPSEVLATFVCVEGAPEGFGDEVTRKRNRQNAVDIEDYAALDERQSRWRDTLALVDTVYVCKQGEDDPANGAQVFNIREAALALACGITGQDWAEFVVAAKVDRRRLFKSDFGAAANSASTYARVFSDALTAKELWRAVQVSRLVDEATRARAAAEADPRTLPAGSLRAAEVLREGRWLLLHVLFIKTGLRRGEALYLTAEERTRVSTAVDAVAQALVTAAQGQAWGKQARAVFENRADCATLKARVMQALPQAL